MKMLVKVRGPLLQLSPSRACVVREIGVVFVQPEAFL